MSAKRKRPRRKVLTHRDLANRPKEPHPAAWLYPAKTCMHPMLRRMLGEILAIELDLAAKGVLWAP